MKKASIAALVAACLMVCGAACAQGTLRLDGAIEAGQTLTIPAPYSGMTGDYIVRAGDELAAGETLFTISATEITADCDGVVAALYAHPGDSAAYITGRYGALAYLEQGVVYTGDCTISGAASDSENKIVHPGERVYVRSVSSNSRKGTARVISVSGKGYTLEVETSDELRVDEQIKVYRESNFDSDSCIGSGKLNRADPVAVSAEGYVLGVYVKEGDSVSRGDLLMTVVPDQIGAATGGDGAVVMPEDGVLLSVSAQSGAQIAKDAPMATYCPAGSLQLVCSVDENDLGGLRPGMKAAVTLDALPGETIQATLVKIARAANERGEFDVTFSLEADESLRVGMSATAEL